MPTTTVEMGEPLAWDGPAVEMPEGHHVRWLVRRDLPEALAVEAALSPGPWGEAGFLDALRERDAIGMVVDHGEAVVGSMVYRLRPHHIRVLALAASTRAAGQALLHRLQGKLTRGRRAVARWDGWLARDPEGAPFLVRWSAVPRGVGALLGSLPEALRWDALVDAGIKG
jgi:hypothetical protein